MIVKFLLRWFVSSLGLWIAASLISGISYNKSISVIIIAGLVLAVINSVIKPILILLSLPAILFSLGLFMIIINGVTVSLVGRLYPELRISSFTSAVLAGLVIGLVNYLVTTIVEES
jgi:putative membrane protein